MSGPLQMRQLDDLNLSSALTNRHVSRLFPEENVSLRNCYATRVFGQILGLTLVPDQEMSFRRRP
jgi:hypothetical protein